MIEKVATNRLNFEQHRPILFANVDRLDDIKTLSLPTGQHFGLFLACDAKRASNELIDDVAGFLLTSGMVYVNLYGEDRDRLRSRFVDEIVRRDPVETFDNVIKTGDTGSASLDAALFSFLFIGFPAEAYEQTCAFELVICVGMAKQARRLKIMLRNQGPLRRRQLRRGWPTLEQGTRRLNRIQRMLSHSSPA